MAGQGCERCESPQQAKGAQRNLPLQASHSFNVEIPSLGDGGIHLL